MRLSVVVRSKDEADRLRLTLVSLARQTLAAEVVVVDDGSSDHTQAVLREATIGDLRVVRHPTPAGRSGAANAGARAASGDVLIFMDEDTLASEDLVAAHAALHAAQPGRIGRGETFHLRSARFFQDPEAGTPWPGDEARLMGLAADDLARLRLSRDQVAAGRAALDPRAEPGIYPVAASRKLHELEMDALRRHPDCSVLWATASGHNLSVERETFLRAGGFDETIDCNEHRELAYRLCAAGLCMAPVDDARSYHQTHRTGLRDPLIDSGWEERFYRAHPVPAVKLLSVFWASLAPKSRIPPEARIHDILGLERAARGDDGIDYDAARRCIPTLPVLHAAPA